ncbi:hypothetical protein E2320_019523 [Naja naja]|nr:hypothetical protein E2320_019523 [Naja naja]
MAHSREVDNAQQQHTEALSAEVHGQKAGNVTTLNVQITLMKEKSKNYQSNGQWNHWGHWSGCSKSCDGGWEKRIRICQGAATTGQQCEGSGDEVRRCSEQRCPEYQGKGFTSIEEEKGEATVFVYEKA